MAKENKQEKPLGFLKRLFLKIAIIQSVKKLENMKGSYKTTLYGIILALGILMTQIGYVLDADPNTNIDIKIVIGAIMAVIGAFKMGASARDKDVSTEAEKAAGTEVK